MTPKKQEKQEKGRCLSEGQQQDQPPTSTECVSPRLRFYTIQSVTARIRKALLQERFERVKVSCPCRDIFSLSQACSPHLSPTTLQRSFLINKFPGNGNPSTMATHQKEQLLAKFDKKLRSAFCSTSVKSWFMGWTTKFRSWVAQHTNFVWYSLQAAVICKPFFLKPFFLKPAFVWFALMFLIPVHVWYTLGSQPQAWRQDGPRHGQTHLHQPQQVITWLTENPLHNDPFLWINLFLGHRNPRLWCQSDLALFKTFWKRAEGL